MSLLQAMIMAVLQGVTELFPVSSLGHAVILPALLSWPLDRHDPTFLPFLVVLHLGTATALLLYFWRDWVGILLALFGRGDERRESLRLLGLIVLATIPAVIIGFAAEKPLRALFGSPEVAAGFLILNGFVLFAGERLRRRSGDNGLDDLGWRGALLIGLFQCTALFPGISRSGATMVGGLLTGLHHRESARFSFLIATPVIIGAGVLEVPKMLHAGAGLTMQTLGAGAGAVAGIAAFLSIAFMMRYFRKHDFDALDPFAWYCWLAGAVSLGLLTL